MPETTIPEVVTLVKGEPGAPDIRRFDSVSLNTEIDQMMSTLTEAEHVAAFAYLDKNGPAMAIVGKVPKKLVPFGHAEWTVTGAVRIDDIKHPDWKVGLRWKF